MADYPRNAPLAYARVKRLRVPNPRIDRIPTGRPQQGQFLSPEPMEGSDILRISFRILSCIPFWGIAWYKVYQPPRQQSHLKTQPVEPHSFVLQSFFNFPKSFINIFGCFLFIVSWNYDAMFLQDRASESADASSGFKLYHYDPTIPGAVIFTLLFLASTAFHFWQLIRPRCWFMLPLAIGVEVVGYAARVQSGTPSPDWTLGPFIMQGTLLLVAPALFAATIYMELGRIIAMVDGEGHVKIPLRWLTKIFVIGDVFSFMLQGAGAGLQAGGSLEALDNGSKIVVGGLLVQLICFGVFIVMAVTFDLSIRRAPTVRSLGGAPWKKHMMALYIGSVFIMVRSVFRAIEYIQGFDGYLLSHEPYMYVFDSVLMFLVMALFNWRHPAEIMVYLDRGTPNYKMDPVSVA